MENPTKTVGQIQTAGRVSFIPPVTAEGNQIFCGIYGTRFVEYLTIRHFDENDRMPQVMSAHLQDAMRQLWTVPH